MFKFLSSSNRAPSALFRFGLIAFRSRLVYLANDEKDGSPSLEMRKKRKTRIREGILGVNFHEKKYIGSMRLSPCRRLGGDGGQTRTGDGEGDRCW